jgi:UDP-N-acetylmuramoylalanine--D-glutamate ligase
MEYHGQSAVVLGLGQSGAAAAELLQSLGARPVVCDSSDSPQLRERAEALGRKGIASILGPAADSDPAGYDFAVLSPGIDPSAPLVRNVSAKNIPVIGELELAFRECSCPVAAITGTNGKTTTTELTTHILKRCGLRAIASGNIGLPFSTAVLGSAELDVMVLEVSSFQLEAIRDFHPRVAAWLNLSPNHLDRYANMGEYRAAKLRIFEKQTAGDDAVVNALSDLPALSARKTTFSAMGGNADFTLRGTEIYFHARRVLDQSRTSLPGVHNAENTMAALAIGKALGLDLGMMAESVSDYSPPSHRCEFVREISGVRWINDSKSTNLDAMEKAILSQPQPLILIAGGKDKGTGFEANAALVRERAKTVFLIGEMRHRIAGDWKNSDCRICGSLGEAVAGAHAAAQAGDTVLFSPGTSSFDMFRNYAERGNTFKTLVNQLNPQPPKQP